MLFQSEIISSLSPCQIHNATFMQCESPKFTAPPSLRQATFGRWPVGFSMDGVHNVRNLGSIGLFLTTVPDPQLSAFKGVKIQPADQPLVIEGRFLSQAATADEYVVSVYYVF